MKFASVKEKIKEKLRDIYDPEIPVNLYDLGLIYGIDCAKETGGTRCVVTMTLTSATCPVSESILAQVRNISQLIEDVPNLTIDTNLVFEPPWSKEKMSDEAKLHLGML
ncbi:MAG: iron-sulfur cluster assembly protein [Sulfurimonas sp.]